MFYVYGLLDPRDDVIFYIGKGKGVRAKQHVIDARLADGNTSKLAKIDEINAAQLTVRELIFAKNLKDEHQAFLVESMLIHQAEAERRVWNIAAQLSNDDPGHHREKFRPIVSSNHVHNLPEFEFTDKELKDFREELFDALRPLFNRVVEVVPEFKTANDRTTDFLKSKPIRDGYGKGFEFVVYCRDYGSVEFQYFHRAKPTEEQIAHSIKIADKLELAHGGKEAKVRCTYRGLSLLEIDVVIAKLNGFITSVKSHL